MPPPQATEDLYTTLQRYQVLLLAAGRRLWRGMLPGDFDGSWLRIAPQLVQFTAGAQLAAARAGVEYVPQVLEETGQPDESLAAIRPQAFSGQASDGRSLDGLLQGSVVAAKRAATTRTVVETANGIRRRTTIPGLDGGEALAYGQRWLEQALQSAVNDAARDATQAQIAVRQNFGFVRVANPPCCSRCAVLAGSWYRWNTINPRHPGCDCPLVPSLESRADDFRIDPNELVRRGLVKDLSANQRERLADGADLMKVLNESRDAWRSRLAADRRRTREQARRQPWGPGGNEPPAGSTVHDLMARLTSQVEFARAARAVGIAV